LIGSMTLSRAATFYLLAYYCICAHLKLKILIGIFSMIWIFIQSQIP